MVYNKDKIKSFTDLNAYKEAHKLVLMIYKITKDFPKEERFSLIDQLRRAAVSITSNIAEGFSRNTNKDKCQFYALASGSLSELQSQLLIAKDLKYLDQQTFNLIAQQSIIVRKLLSGLKRIKYQNDFNKWDNMIEKTVDLFLRLNTEKAEIVATVLFTERTMNKEIMSEKDILQAVMKWKQKRRPPISETEVAETIRNLGMLKWFQLIPSADLPIRDEWAQ